MTGDQPVWWMHTVIDEESLHNPLCGWCGGDPKDPKSDCLTPPAYRGEVRQPRGTFDVFACVEHASTLRQRGDLVRIASWCSR